MTKKITDKEKILENTLISLKSIQNEEDDSNQSELVTMATIKHEGKSDIISYEDTEVTGFEGSVTTIRVDSEKSAIITRAGSANSVLLLEIGRKNFCQYGTPYGSMQIGVYTHEIKNTIRKDGKLYMKYTLDINSSFLSDNEIILQIVKK